MLTKLSIFFLCLCLSVFQVSRPPLTDKSIQSHNRTAMHFTQGALRHWRFMASFNNKIFEIIFTTVALYVLLEFGDVDFSCSTDDYQLCMDLYVLKAATIEQDMVDKGCLTLKSDCEDHSLYSTYKRDGSTKPVTDFLVVPGLCNATDRDWTDGRFLACSSWVFISSPDKYQDSSVSVTDSSRKWSASPRFYTTPATFTSNTSLPEVQAILASDVYASAKNLVAFFEYCECVEVGSDLENSFCQLAASIGFALGFGFFLVLIAEYFVHSVLESEGDNVYVSSKILVVRVVFLVLHSCYVLIVHGTVEPNSDCNTPELASSARMLKTAGNVWVAIGLIFGLLEVLSINKSRTDSNNSVSAASPSANTSIMGGGMKANPAFDDPVEAEDSPL
eukprot:m.99513 g.99513  ORF g.99513 m.99513 type:complete len:390 (-) comp18613_c1_seq2:50-1219(-)